MILMLKWSGWINISTTECLLAKMAGCRLHTFRDNLNDFLSMLLWLQISVIDQWRLWTFVCHLHTCFLTVAGNNFKVKVKSITKFQFDSTYSRANRSRGLALLSPVSFATVERENETHRWMSDVDLSSTIMMTHQKSFFSPQISRFFRNSHESMKIAFRFYVKINVVVYVVYLMHIPACIKIKHNSLHSVCHLHNHEYAKDIVIYKGGIF